MILKTMSAHSTMKEDDEEEEEISCVPWREGRQCKNQSVAISREPESESKCETQQAMNYNTRFIPNPAHTCSG